tara:strand:+ start:132 stop:335 length:204 start_codon:yes stop_codon:yes gene_type:complete
MSGVDELMDRMINSLILIGHSHESALELIQNDIVKAKKDIDEYWEHIEQEIDNYVETQVDASKLGEV